MSGLTEYRNYDSAYRGSKAERRPFKIYNIGGKHLENERADASSGVDGIWFWVNPSECNWRTPLRTSVEQVQGGAIHQEWGRMHENQFGTQGGERYKFDQTTISFSFQSGNIIPNGDLDSTRGKDIAPKKNNVDGRTVPPPPGKSHREIVPPGIGNFYDFLALLNAPSTLANGQPNFVVIEYFSMLFPSMTLFGFFSQEGVSWSDRADTPLGFTWTATFVLFKSFPAMWNSKGFKDIYLEQMFPGRRT